MEKDKALSAAERRAAKERARKRKKRSPEAADAPTRRPDALAVGAVAIEEKSAPSEPGSQAAELPRSQRLGSVLVAAESKAARTTPAAERSEHVFSERSIQTLNRAELLELSEKITVDGSTLRQIYETHLVGERGLRRLVAEHLRGGDLRKILHEEVLERELDFERDPALRDVALPGDDAATTAGSNSATTLDELLRQADGDSADRGEEVAFFKARARYEAERLQQHQQHRRALDMVIVGALIVLVVLVIMLYLTRS